MQLTPSTAEYLGVHPISDPEQNIKWGIKYMSQLLNKYNWDISLALAAYNAGPWNVKKYGNKIPPFKETKNYVKYIMNTYNNLA
jgi:soluble lytic murein transglycosylase-like protein